MRSKRSRFPKWKCELRERISPPKPAKTARLPSPRFPPGPRRCKSSDAVIVKWNCRKCLNRARRSPIQVELKGGTILSGLVRDAITKTPIPEAQVELAGSTQTAKTDADGRFRLEDIAAGPVKLKVVATGYPSRKQDAELKTGEESLVEIGLTGEAVLTGSVVASEGEKPLAGVQVQVAGNSRKTQTNDKGEFRLGILPAGPTELEVTLAGNQPAAVSRTLNPGEETHVDIALTGAAVLDWLGPQRSGPAVAGGCHSC